MEQRSRGGTPPEPAGEDARATILPLPVKNSVKMRSRRCGDRKILLSWFRSCCLQGERQNKPRMELANGSSARKITIRSGGHGCKLYPFPGVGGMDFRGKNWDFFVSRRWQSDDLHDARPV